MGPPVKLLESTPSSKFGAGDAKRPTPAWKLKLQSRTSITPTVTPLKIADKGHKQSDLPEDDSTSGVDDATTRSNDSREQEQKDLARTELGAELKLNLIKSPLLPKPQTERPMMSRDPAALLHRLQGLRSAGADMLTDVTQPGQPNSSAPPASPRPTLPASASWPQPSTPGDIPSSPLFTPPRLTAPAGSFTANATPTRPVGALTPSTSLPHAGASCATPSGAWPFVDRPGASTSALTGLRQQEAKDTGGGFLTHYTDPRSLATPLAPANTTPGRPSGALALLTPGVCTPGLGHGGGTPGGAAGVSTPLSVLRSMHRLQHLQRLQREGAQLVAAMGGGEGS